MSPKITYIDWPDRSRREVGKAISLVEAAESSELFAIERLIQQVLPRLELEGYEAVNKLPESKLDTRPIKPKKT